MSKQHLVAGVLAVTLLLSVWVYAVYTDSTPTSNSTPTVTEEPLARRKPTKVPIPTATTTRMPTATATATPTIGLLTDWMATVEARGCFEPTPVTTATPEQEFPPLKLHLPVCER